MTQQSYDVVVVGAGLAGNAAALTAAEAGLTVCLLEKGEAYGGTSVKAGGALVFAGTDHQRDAGVDDGSEQLRCAILAIGQGANDSETVSAYIDNQLDTYTWLRDRGVEFDYSADLQPGQLNRLHTSVPGHVTDVLHRHVLQHPGVTYRVRTAALRLERDALGRVERVRVHTDGAEETLNAQRGVVIASGGFTRADDLLATFAPEWMATTRMGGADNTGDGLRMAWELGAGLADMAYIEASFGASVRHYPDLAEHPDSEPKLLFPNGQGALIVNREGRRFTNEALNYKQISIDCVRQPDGLAFQVFDAKVMDRSLPTPSPANFKEARAQGLLRESATVEGLAQELGIDPAALAETISTYNGFVDARTDPSFGRPIVDYGSPGAGRIDTAPFYAFPCRCGLTTTYCGLTVDRQLQVLNVFGEPIAGLWAAGEVVGGFHGAGYYSGTGLGKAAVFGRAAALAVSR